MTQREFDDTLYQRSHAAVARLMARYGWRLIEHDEFVRQVFACLAEESFSAPEAAAMNIYCRCLYAACFGHEGAERQEIGFAELYRYLHALSFRLVAQLPSDLRDELVHETVARIWQRLGSYRKPGAFFAVGAMELHSVLRPCWQRPPPLSVEDVAEQLAAPDSNDPAASSVDSDLRQQVRACFEQAYREHPRAKKQLDVIWLTYTGYADSAISELLGTPVRNVYVLRSRGLDLLRKQADWQQLAIDFDLLHAARPAGEERVYQ